MTAPQEKPRLYYDCPLKAAWMAKYFGMKLWVGGFMLQEESVLGFLATYAVAPTASFKDVGGTVIHRDSLHVLEPQDLDIIYRTNGYCQTVGVHIGIPKTIAQLEARATIIQRNGLAFHYPDKVGT